MFPPFNDRASSTLNMMVQEARSGKLEQVEPELILWVLLKKEKRLPDGLLQNLGIDVDRIIPEIERYFVSATSPTSPAFTDLGEKALLQAEKEAESLGHQVIANEHLLLAILRMSEGAIPGIFAKVGLKQDEIADRLATLLRAGPSPTRAVPPEELSDAQPFERLGNTVHQLMYFANQERVFLGDGILGTEHLLLAIVSGFRCAAGEILHDLGIEYERLRAQCELLRIPVPVPFDVKMGGELSSTLDQVIFLGAAVADQFGDKTVGTSHLLLAFLQEPSNTGGKALRGLGLTPARVEQAAPARRDENLPAAGLEPSARTKLYEQAVVRQMVGVHYPDAEHIDSVAVHESVEGYGSWKGMVEVFRLRGDPRIQRCFAWVERVDDFGRPSSKVVMMLAIPPLDAPQAAVRRSLVKS